MKQWVLSLVAAIACAAGAQTLTALDPSQTYTTGNIVNPGTTPTDSTGTWQNIGLWNQGLPCWGPGGPVYCGPMPYYNQGSFNFSYGTTDVYQVSNIAKALPNSGTGLKVDGYNFSFTAKNGNGWDDGRVDYLYAYVHLTDNNNGVVYYKSYDLNYKFDWTTFNYSENFKTPYATKDLNNVTYGFVGRDNNFWAGPYGPEIYNVSFSLKYSVDQCAISVLSSPTCPGYMDALAKITTTPAATEPVVPLTATSTSPTSTTTITVEPTTVTTTNTTTVGQPTIVAPAISAPAPAATTASTATSTQSNKESTTNNSVALSVISKNQERDAAALSVSQTAVSQAAQAAQQSQQEAASVAASAVSNSQTANVVSMGGPQVPGTGIKVNVGTSVSNQTLSTMSAPGTNTASALNPPPQSLNFVQPVSVVTQEQPMPMQSTTMANITSVASVQNYAVIPPNFLTDRTNPLTELVEGRTVVQPNTTNTVSGSSVNQNAGDNDAAGGVNIGKMAVAPTGYGDYLNFTLKDAAFYAPREVYRNQRTVDNARALRQLTNDSRHRDMVEQQYRR